MMVRQNILKISIVIFLSLNFLTLSAQNEEKLLPQPGGKFSVGYQSFFLKDSIRSDYINPHLERQIPIQTWYPSSEPNSESRRYIEDEKLLIEMFQQSYMRQDSTALHNLNTLRTFSKANAKKLSDKRFPLVVFSHGLGVSKQNYTMIAEELASHGNLVVMIDHPYGGFTVTSNGDVLSSRQDTLLYSKNGNEVLLERMSSWSQDIKFVLDNLLSKTTPLGKEFKNSIDSLKIVVAGHSLGGNVALQYPADDHRVKGSINLDGGTFGNLTKAPSVPNLTLRSEPIYSVKELEDKGRTLEEWTAMGNEIDQVFTSALENSSEAYEIKIKGVGHMSFSDLPFVLPNTITRFGGKLMEFQKASDLILELINEFLLANFNDREPKFREITDQCSTCELKKYRKM